MFSNNRAVNVLAAARIFLFASRDVWFVVGLPVFLRTELGWSFWQVGAFLAVWVIGYGDRPGLGAALFVARSTDGASPTAAPPPGSRSSSPPSPPRSRSRSAPTSTRQPSSSSGLIVFGVVFALNSAVHSYLILAYADGDKVAMNVGFYYMANAGGRLAGTVLSGAALPVAGPRGLPLGVGGLRARRRVHLAFAANPHPDQGTADSVAPAVRVCSLKWSLATGLRSKRPLARSCSLDRYDIRSRFRGTRPYQQSPSRARARAQASVGIE